jgi:hypothetical protein
MSDTFPGHMVAHWRWNRGFRQSQILIDNTHRGVRIYSHDAMNTGPFMFPRTIAVTIEVLLCVVNGDQYRISETK